VKTRDKIISAAKSRLLGKATQSYRDYVHTLIVCATVKATDLEDQRKGYSKDICNEAERVAKLDEAEAYGVFRAVFGVALDQCDHSQIDSVFREIDSEIRSPEEQAVYDRGVRSEARAYFEKAAARMTGGEKSSKLCESRETFEGLEDDEDIKALGRMRRGRKGGHGVQLGR